MDGVEGAFDVDEYKQAWDDIKTIAMEFTDGLYETFNIERESASSLIASASAALVLLLAY